jgi:hypothetical protein
MESLGKRALDVAFKELGVAEDPPHSNTGPRIREYLKPCVRGDKNQLLGLTASNWCMAFSSWCMSMALEDGEMPPHGYRAGVVEAVADVRSPHAKFSGVWRPVETVRKKLWTPFEGDLAIWDRSTTDPNTSWWRHVNRVVKYDAGVGEFDTIGGNERDQVRVAAHHVSEVKLLGFIAYPQPEDKPEPKQIDALTHANLLGLVARTIDGMLRDSHTEMMESHHMDDED